MPNLRGKTWTTTTPANVEDAQYWEDHLISDTAAAKAASSVQTVNSTPPDASGNVDVVALPAGGTTGQVLTKISNTSGDADWLDPASSGHTIVDEDDNDMPYRSSLQFLNAEVSDDSVNDATVVDCKGAKGDAATVTVGTTSTLQPGSSATVTNSGTTSAAIFNFGIPQGADGTDGEDGVSVTGVTLLSTSGKVKTYRMSFSNNTYFDYNVTDGADGTGAGDMLQDDYDHDQTVLNAGGIDAYVGSEIGKLDVSDSAVSGKYVSAVSETDGKISVTREDLPVITDTYDGTSSNGMSGKAVKSAIDALDVSDSVVSGQYVSAVSETDGKISVTRASLPSIPAAANDGQLTIQQNGTTKGTFTADQSGNTSVDIQTDDWVATASVSSGFITFSGIDDSGNYGYDVYINITSASTNKNPTTQLSSISGEGTSSMTVTYTTDADDGTNNAKLRRIK